MQKVIARNVAMSLNALEYLKQLFLSSIQTFFCLYSTDAEWTDPIIYFFLFLAITWYAKKFQPKISQIRPGNGKLSFELQ